MRKVRRFALETIDVMGQTGIGAVERPDGRFVLYPDFWMQTCSLSDKLKKIHRRNCQLEYQLAQLRFELDQLQRTVDAGSPESACDRPVR